MNKQKFDHVDMMQNSDRWPHWPILPVKRTMQVSHQLGVMVAGQGPVVYGLSMFDVTREKLDTCAREEFESFEALHAAGWVVD